MRKLAYLYTSIIALSLILNACSKKNNDNNTGGEPKTEDTKPTSPSVYVAGNSYKTYVSDPNGTGTTFVGVEYIAGDNGSKLIISAPHGGTTRPAYMRTRTSDYTYGTLATDPYNNDKSFSATEDSNTKEFAIAIADSIKKKTGLRPHLVLNYLHRAKLDANRRIEVASQGDKNAENVWKAYMAYIDSAKKTINHYHSSGLVIDVHGNGHSPQRTEVGYLIDKDDFTKYASSLNNLINSTSIKAMADENTSLASLLTGDYALGTLISDKLNIKATPSKAYPQPTDKTYFGNGEYFNGGYITARFGSKQSGKISSIQLEFNSSVRTNDSTRPKYAGLVADALKAYMDKYFK